MSTQGLVFDWLLQYTPDATGLSDSEDIYSPWKYVPILVGDSLKRKQEENLHLVEFGQTASIVNANILEILPPTG